MNGSMERNQVLREYLDDQDWLREPDYSKFISINGKQSDGTRLVIQEQSGREYYIRYETINAITLFIHRPYDTINELKYLFPSAAKESGIENYNLDMLIHEQKFLVHDVRLIERRAVNAIASLLDEINKRRLGDIQRYYTVPYIRLIRKNYEYFNIEYFRENSRAYLFSVGRPTRVIPREKVANEATDW